MYKDYLSSLSSRALSLKKAEAALRSINATKELPHNAVDSRIVELYSDGCSIGEIALEVGRSKGYVSRNLERFARIYFRCEKAYWEQDKLEFANRKIKESGLHSIDKLTWSNKLGVEKETFESFKKLARKEGVWVLEELELMNEDTEDTERAFKFWRIVRLIGMDAYRKLVDAAGLTK